MSKLFFSILLGLFLLGLSAPVFAETYKQNAVTDLKFTCTLNDAIPSASATYNITINYPNGTTFINNKLATALGQGLFNYSLNLTEEGTYKIVSFCYDSPYSYSSTDYVDVSYNGKPTPDGIIIVFFSVGFLIAIGFLSFLVIYNIGHLAQMDYDLGDLIKNISAYFVLLGLFFLSSFYMGNQMIDTIMVWVISITGFTNVGMSFLFFIIVLLAKRKEKIENAW